MSCPYCGTTSVPPPRQIILGRVHAEETRPPCPRCADFLNEKRVNDAVLSACKNCGGVWLDATTVERLRRAPDGEVDRAAAQIGARADTFAAPDRSLAISCPICRTHLRRFAIAGTPHAVDVCDAHGTWFDQA